MMKSPSILILLFAGLLMGALPFQAFAGEKSLPAKLVGTDILIQHLRGENSVSADPSYGEFSTRALTPSTMSIRVRRGLTIILKIDRQTKDDWVRINSQAIGDFEDKRGIFLLRGELRRVISRGKHRSQRRKKIRVFHRRVAATLYEKDDEEFGLFMTAHLVIDRKQHFLELHSSFFSNARTVTTEVHPVQVENLPLIGCGSEEGSHVPASSTDPHTRSSGPLKIAEIYTVADNLYGSLEPDTNAEIAARVNEANVFYENDVN
ncbi:MAG: hypothetical protein KDD70_05150, partial [Bdellovibrionales bacterium]|nr:hypothetical protein [Bdellovibrionales bacterium]